MVVAVNAVMAMYGLGVDICVWASACIWVFIFDIGFTLEGMPDVEVP